MQALWDKDVEVVSTDISSKNLSGSRGGLGVSMRLEAE